MVRVCQSELRKVRPKERAKNKSIQVPGCNDFLSDEEQEKMKGKPENETMN